jgi:transcriptional regulator with XRE-family HTH domain
VKNSAPTVGNEAAARRLRAFRESRQLSQEEVSAVIGVSASTLSRLESGQRRITVEVLIALARAYGTTLDELVTDEPTGDPRVSFRPLKRGPMTIVPLYHRAGAVGAFKVLLHPEQTGDEAEQRSHEGWQWLVVLEGRLLLTLERGRFDLGPGEAAEFDTRAPHHFATADGRPVEYLVLYGAQTARVRLRVSDRTRSDED